MEDWREWKEEAGRFESLCLRESNCSICLSISCFFAESYVRALSKYSFKSKGSPPFSPSGHLRHLRLENTDSSGCKSHNILPLTSSI